MILFSLEVHVKMNSNVYWVRLFIKNSNKSEFVEVEGVGFWVDSHIWAVLP